MSSSGAVGSGAVFVVPGGIADPAVPSGGNVYDRRTLEELARAGVPVREVRVDGAWPDPDSAGREGLARALADLPDGTPVLIDGLVACGVPEVVVPAAARLRLAVLVHLPLADETGTPPESASVLESREGAVLRAAELTVATSGHAARDLARRHGLDPARVHTVEPGTDPAPVAPGTDGATRLLCVASVTPRKGHDVLVEALAANRGRRWECVCAGPEPAGSAFPRQVRHRIGEHGLSHRVRFTGPLEPPALDRAYAEADLVLLPSRAETFGMAAAEALARGIPVAASTAGALPATVGRSPDGTVPGLLVPPDDAPALGAAIGRWLEEADLRDELRAAARARRAELRTWQSAARDMAGVLERLTAAAARRTREEAR
ncbi:glycosyltransferase family 4 protein [Nocardiopsis sp. RSe5-2]|uniref:Glycosyltransferase family 4 protein n=1 Tax=Nocardiopsis endophytica TaxID=3018445 RepID=A0ABT4TZN0_9ACTN|nr:glycosyltransferase family 4 protein [Nocardiopsis endophytica]MDA2810159.1 glycosyltransferase family 4 protein [Nocardiopsis endophytica]